MEKYFKCELFENKDFLPSEKFSIFQHELTLNDDVINNDTTNPKVPFKNQKIEFKRFGVVSKLVIICEDNIG